MRGTKEGGRRCYYVIAIQLSQILRIILKALNNNKC